MCFLIITLGALATSNLEDGFGIRVPCLISELTQEWLIAIGAYTLPLQVQLFVV